MDIHRLKETVVLVIEHGTVVGGADKAGIAEIRHRRVGVGQIGHLLPGVVAKFIAPGLTADAVLVEAGGIGAEIVAVLAEEGRQVFLIVGQAVTVVVQAAVVGIERIGRGRVGPLEPAVFPGVGHAVAVGVHRGRIGAAAGGNQQRAAFVAVPEAVKIRVRIIRVAGQELVGPPLRTVLGEEHVGEFLDAGQAVVVGVAEQGLVPGLAGGRDVVVAVAGRVERPAVRNAVAVGVGRLRIGRPADDIIHGIVIRLALGTDDSGEEFLAGREGAGVAGAEAAADLRRLPGADPSRHRVETEGLIDFVVTQHPQTRRLQFVADRGIRSLSIADALAVVGLNHRHPLPDTGGEACFGGILKIGHRRAAVNPVGRSHIFFVHT